MATPPKLPDGINASFDKPITIWVHDDVIADKLKGKRLMVAALSIAEHKNVDSAVGVIEVVHGEYKVPGGVFVKLLLHAAQTITKITAGFPRFERTGSGGGLH